MKRLALGTTWEELLCTISPRSYYKKWGKTSLTYSTQQTEQILAFMKISCYLRLFLSAAKVITCNQRIVIYILQGGICWYEPGGMILHNSLKRDCSEEKNVL